MLNLIGVLTIVLMTICPAPDNSVFLAKYEWHDAWVFADGTDVITLTGDAQSVTWASTTEIVAVVTKVGQDCAEWPGGYSGVIAAGEHDLSHISFYTSKPTAVTLTGFKSEASDTVCGFGVFAVVLVVLAVMFIWAVSAKKPI